ncbi:MAG: efflux RND transporter permease subunit [Bacteroidales bacterium]|nr:efflux RND transporter permease subunit [Bacteroidales bacterium]
MRKLITQFVKYPFYANIIIAVLIIGGVISILSMKKSFFPELSTRDIFVSVAYPGASPKEMEEAITVRIEEAIRGIAGIKEVNSTSSENFSMVRVTTTGEYDLDETLMEVKNAVDGITSFPVDAEKSVVYKQRAATFAMYMALSGDVDLLTLKKYANQIEDDMYASGVISQITIYGYPELEISVEATEADLLRYNLTFDEIAAAIARNNRDISAGMIKSDEEEILIRSRSRSVNPNIIGDIVIRANDDGSYLLIRDAADVKLKFADVASESYMNDKRSVSFAINKLPEEDLAKISEFCNNYANEFNEEHKNINLSITFDFLDLLKGRLNLLYKNGLIGLVLILITLGLFMSFRVSLWVAWGIPASFLAMFIIGSLYGITINMISLFGMILVIGILVDDGIVIAENIYTHFENGKSPKRAAVDGTMEVLPAVTTSVATTIIAFLPLFLIEGRMRFMFEMAFVVVFSLGFSLFESFFVLPGHLGNKYILHSNKKTSTSNKLRKQLDKWVNWMKYNIYGVLLKKIIKWKWIVVVIPGALLLITIGLFGGGFIKSTFFPFVPFDQFTINVAFKPGSGEKKTLEYLRKFDDAVWQVDKELREELNDTNAFVNFSFISTGFAFEGLEVGSHAGNAFVILADMERRGVSSYEIVQRVKNKIGEIHEAEKFSIAGNSNFGTPVSISLLGKDLDKLNEAKTILINGMKRIASINNITDNNALGKREIKLKLKSKAYFLGLDQTSIVNQVRQGFFGSQAQRLQHGKDELRVWVRYPKTGRINIGQLENMKIKTLFGEFPLSELATYNIERGPVRINRYNSLREVRVDADLFDPIEPVPPVLEKIQKDILPEINTKYPDIKIEYQGQQKDSKEAQDQMVKYFGIAFLLIVLLIMIHFKSFSQAIIIIMMIPLAWLGASWGHGLEGIPVSLISGWGMVALSGVIINDAVVFLAKYNSLLRQGQTVKEAVYNAGLARFRAIVLTTITTSVGFYPIILEKSFQALFLKPMAVTMAYGVFFGTAFLLIFFPVLILLLNDLKVWMKWLWTNKKPSRESMEKAVIYSKRTLDN